MYLNDLELLQPWWLWLLPLPAIIYWLIPAYRTRQPALKVPFFQLLVQTLDETPSAGASQLTPAWWQKLLLLLSWGLLVFALTQPTLLGAPQTRESLGRDVMVVVDLSGSMAARDFHSAAAQQVTTADKGGNISRLDAAKQVLSEFALSRQGDRLGLILFGDAAFVQTPFTADQAVWLALLNQSEVAMAGQSTHLGDAIGLAIRVFSQANSAESVDDAMQAHEQVAIVLTDGNDTGSYVEPIDAAKVAAVKGVRIHMIAMGDPSTVGEQALDMTVIERVAALSGGRAFQAINRTELEQAYAAINELEPQLYASISHRPQTAIHQYPLMIIVSMYLLAFSWLTLKRYLHARICMRE